MNREIKFRVWDILNKKLLSWGDIFDLPAWEIFPGTPEQRAYEVMQYTGLKDKNGKEIYEGDIVSAFNGEIKAEIIYNHCSFEFKWLDKEVARLRVRKSEPMFDNVSLIFEVIGNIHTDPELLDK